MSAFLAICGTRDVILMADAASYSVDGVVTDIRSKIYYSREMKAALVSRGNAAFTDALLRFLADRTFAGFDDAVSRLPDELHSFEKSEIARSLWRPEKRGNWELAIVGWSESLRRPLIYGAFGSRYTDETPFILTREEFMLAGGTLEPEQWPASFLLWAFANEGRGDTFDPKTHGVEIFSAWRQARGNSAFHPERPKVHLVGGFLEVATIGPDGCAKRRLGSWPDQIGELIDGSHPLVLEATTICTDERSDDADIRTLADCDGMNALKKLSWANFKTALAALFVSSNDVRTVVVLADQAAYDALDPPDANTEYLVPEEE